MKWTSFDSGLPDQDGEDVLVWFESYTSASLGFAVVMPPDHKTLKETSSRYYPTHWAEITRP